MALASVTNILPHRKRRSTYRHKPIPVPPARPAAHRARYTKTQLEAIRRRRARVLTVQAQITSNLRLIVAGIAGTAVFVASVILLLLGLSDDRVRTLLAVAAVIGLIAFSLDTIAKYATDEADAR